jgi:ankyrin repeat protein
VRLLLEHGADVNGQGGYYGNALQAASRTGHTDIAIFLKKHGAVAMSVPSEERTKEVGDGEPSDNDNS